MKKNIPLRVLQLLEPYVDDEATLYERVKSENLLISFKDKDPNSDFYFNIVEYKLEEELKLLIDRKPQNQSSTANVRFWIKDSQLSDIFEDWTDILFAYESVNSIYDDPIIKSFSDEFFESFKIIEDDADKKPFNIKQILFLENYLNEASKIVTNQENSDNVKEIEEINESIKHLSSNLSSKPKNWVVRQLSIIWAKSAKLSISTFKELLKELKKKAIKYGVEFIVENGKDIWKYLLENN